MEPDLSGQHFPGSVRLKRRTEFQYLWRTGRRFHTPHFIFLLSRTAGIYPRLGITVSRKVGNAVTRNRVKRLVRECFRRQWYKLPAVDISVIARPSASELDFQSLCCELDHLFQQRLVQEMKSC